MGDTHFSGPLIVPGGFTGDLTGDVTGLVNGASLVKFNETVAFGAFTDGGATVGTFDITASTLPIGALFVGCAITALVGFTGDTSAVITVGDGTDADRYNAGTPNVFVTAANGLALGVPSGVLYHDAAKTIKLTITSAADFTSVTAGSLTIEFFYLT